MTQSPVTTHTDIIFAEHDGTQLVGDLYLPQGVTKAPVLIGVHGGGWQLGTATTTTSALTSPATALRCSRSSTG